MLYPCGEGPATAGVTLYSYDNAGNVVTMSDNVGNPATPNQWSTPTTYTYTSGQLASVTDANAKTVSYLYNAAGQVACIAYPVNVSTGCGTLSAPAAASPSNTIVTRSYNRSGTLQSTNDWLGNSVNYVYGNANYPSSATSITFNHLSTSIMSANYVYDAAGNLQTLTTPSISDAWSYNSDEEQVSSSLSTGTTNAVAYDANGRVTAAASYGAAGTQGFTLAGNAEVSSVTSNVGAGPTTLDYNYNAGDELTCSTLPSTPCPTVGSTPPAGYVGTTYAFNADGQRTSQTNYPSSGSPVTTNYTWNSYGQLCYVGANSQTCGTTPPSGASYAYNGQGLRVSVTTPTTTTDQTWDSVSGGNLPLLLNDATTSTTNPGATTNTSYLYGILLFGGTAPNEQISGSSAYFLLSNPSGVQAVYSASGTLVQQSSYSAYGTQTNTGGAASITPFGFQGTYTDATGLLYSINRFYDPATNQFISVDPDVQQTNQPYAFVNGDPLNATDPLGLQGGVEVGRDPAQGPLNKETVSSINWGGIIKFLTIDLLEGPSAAIASKKQTVGICLNGSAGFLGGGVGSACLGIDGRDKAFVSETIGHGTSTPGVSVGPSLIFSNAKSASDMKAYFHYIGGSYGSGPSINFEFEYGRSASGEKIIVGSAGVGFGPSPGADIHGGKSYTWVQGG